MTYEELLAEKERLLEEKERLTRLNDKVGIVCAAMYVLLAFLLVYKLGKKHSRRD